MANEKKLLVNIDTPFEAVVESDQAGMRLTWDPDNFKRLSAIEVKRLSKANRDRYEVFRELADEAAKQSDEDDRIAASIGTGGIAARATDRLKVASSKEGMVTRWERPDMLDVRRSQGWRIAKKGYKTLSGDGEKSDGYHRIGSKGQEELVLMEIGEREHKRMVQDKKNRRQRALSAINNDAKEQLRRLGSQAAGEAMDIVEDGDGSDGAAFKAISQEGGN